MKEQQVNITQALPDKNKVSAPRSSSRKVAPLPSSRKVFIRDIRGACGGFTLIELLVVVLIIGILAAIAVPQYQVAVDKSRVKAMFPVMRHIVNAEELYKLANGNYTYDFRELNLDLPTKSISSEGGKLYTPDERIYTLSSGGTYPHITGYPGDGTMIYWALGTKYYLCYPNGTDRGRRLCKSLGCSDASGMYCSFRP